ncbi:glycoside hydrolase family 5 protein [Rhodobacter calidifons]|uniref:Glycoside hydrolase family 5 protein n=1 Tax=Rhodobacter calidifons TaxID=2715277 RepID=A0ABX0G6V7_9RHOB|nr:cellulase family glycosylhydrolase [Rhodobacter calidifons]NHB76864.1 glycoside hydrolase family 5 protein [Rhodobacter calidifons]
MRLSLTLCIALALAGSLAGAEPILLKRGINGDLWHNWGSIAELRADPEALAVFPDWRRMVTPAMMEALSEQGFDFIRMPTDPGPALAAGPGAEQDRLIDGMIAAVQMGLDADLKVILDLHPLPRGAEIGGIESLLGSHFPDYVALVARIAQRLAELPQDRVALELLNEPSFDCEGVYAGAPPKWPAMQAELHAAARAEAPDLTIILTGACWGQANALASLDPAHIGDDSVLWTFHSYVPFAYSHQGAVWTEAPVRYLRDLPYPPSLMTPDTAARVIADSAARMAEAEGLADEGAIAREVEAYAGTADSDATYEIAVAASWADAHGIPRDRILLGEFGALHTADGVTQPIEWYHAFLADKRRAAEAAGMGWAVLSWKGDMGVADPEAPDRRLSPGTCRALGLPCGN